MGAVMVIITFLIVMLADFLPNIKVRGRRENIIYAAMLAISFPLAVYMTITEKSPLLLEKMESFAKFIISAR